MALFCSCTHNRLEHVMGERLSDGHVGKCQHESCPCSAYHASKDNQDIYKLKFILRLIIFGVVTGIVIGLVCVAIGAVLDNLEFTVKNPTFLTYENGTRISDTPNNLSNPIEGLQTIVGMIVFFGFYIIGAIFIGSAYDHEKRRAINEK